MGDMDGGDGMGEMMMMTMTFGKFTDYKVTIVWDWWKVTTVTQYFFSWVLIVLLVILLFIVKMPMLAVVEEKLRQLKANTKDINSDHNNPNIATAAEEPLREPAATEGARYSILDGHQQVDMRETILKRLPKTSSKSMWMMRILHAFLCAVGYGLALLLMLVAMTYNVGLCIALVVGYFIGDLLFFSDTIRSAPITTIGSAFTVNTLQAQECCSL